MDLERAKQLATELLAALNATPEAPPAADPDAPFGRNLAGEPNFAPGWYACTSMRQAAEAAGVANFSVLIGGGIKQGAAQLYQDFRPDLLLIEKVIVNLGKSPWGQDWLSDPENRAVTAASYVRMFGFKPVTRQPDGTLVEVE